MKFMRQHEQLLGRWFIYFGIFLMVCGILGYASNPVAAKTALLSGGSFGALCIGWGIWLKKGGGLIPLIGAGVTTLMLCAAFTWRSIVTWQAVVEGEPKRFAASLISVMLVGSVLTLGNLLLRWKQRD